MSGTSGSNIQESKMDSTTVMYVPRPDLKNGMLPIPNLAGLDARIYPSVANNV